MLRNKTVTECWNILKYEIEGIIDQFVPFKKQKKLFKKIVYKQTMWRVYIDVPESMKTTQITKRYLMQLRVILDNQKEAMSKN